VKLRLVVGGRSLKVTTHNIVGEIVGRRYPEEVVLTGGHYDGHDISQAAADNASGIAAITEAARVLVPHADRIDRTMRFVAFAAEEVGLVGSGHYAADHADELDRLRFMLNVDGAAGPGPFRVAFDRWPELMPVVTAMGREMCYPLEAAQGIGVYSDNFAFFLAGVPTGTMACADTGTRGRGFGHTAADTVDKPSMRNLQECTAVVARILLRVANLENWPVARRRSPARVKRLLKDEDLLETLRWEARDPFAKRAGRRPPKGYW
jgi:Zn-dependent M28 family amino/carboxypeptidase